MVRIQAIVSAGEISRKPKILTERFNRLCSAFSLDNGQVDNSEGNCQVLIGLKNQSIQTTRICTFKSDKYPEVGVYQSPVLKRLIFFGEDTIGAQGSVLATTLEPKSSLPECSAFSSQTTFDNQLHEFLHTLYKQF